MLGFQACTTLSHLCGAEDGTQAHENASCVTRSRLTLCLMSPTGDQRREDITTTQQTGKAGHQAACGGPPGFTLYTRLHAQEVWALSNLHYNLNSGSVTDDHTMLVCHSLLYLSGCL